MSEARLTIPVAGWWGIVGVIGLLSNAIVRLTPMALEPLQAGVGAGVLAAYVANVVFFAWSEGWRGFHQRFSPRVVSRAATLRGEAPVVRKVLAPLFCMGLFGATRKRRIVSWTLITVIVLLVIGVRQLPQPWRGVVDAGVVVGLSVGVLSILWFVLGAVRGTWTGVDPELPESEATPQPA